MKVGDVFYKKCTITEISSRNGMVSEYEEEVLYLDEMKNMQKQEALYLMWKIRENIPDGDEYLKYRDAIREGIKALEKDIPKLVEIKPWSPTYCPTCGHELSESQGDGYYSHPTFLERCPNVECGQRLQW